MPSFNVCPSCQSKNVSHTRQDGITTCRCDKCHFFTESKSNHDESVGRKYDSGKLQYSLFDPFAKAWAVGVLTVGAIKYSAGNWAHVENARERYYNALLRHLEAWYAGESDDPETLMPHLAHAMCCLIFITAMTTPRDLAEVQRRTAAAIEKIMAMKSEKEVTP